MEENEQVAILMRGLRGQNLRDSQFADENVQLRLVEVYDMANLIFLYAFCWLMWSIISLFYLHKSEVLFDGWQKYMQDMALENPSVFVLTSYKS